MRHEHGYINKIMDILQVISPKTKLSVFKFPVTLIPCVHLSHCPIKRLMNKLSSGLLYELAKQLHHHDFYQHKDKAFNVHILLDRLRIRLPVALIESNHT
jgi:hypothetical protein